MAHSSSIFSRVPIDLPNRSGFDLSHENLGTATCGTLIPVLCDELLPNDTVSLGSSFQVQLPPMATDFYGRVDYVLEAFFVPMRLLWGGWESFMTHPTSKPQYPTGTPVEGKSKYLPQIRLYPSACGPASLADYLGFKSPVQNTADTAFSFTQNAMPFLAYHRIFDDWYRDSRIQAPVFYRPDGKKAAINASNIPYVSGGETTPIVFSAEGGTDVSSDLGDSEVLYSLRQRNWSKDYFTSSSTMPTAGSPVDVVLEQNLDADYKFTIADLRAANSLQKWLERNNIAGYRYSDQIYAQYGCYPSDAIMDKCIYLGRQVQNVYTRSVFQTTPDNASSGSPFGGVGAKYGSSQSIGQGSLIDNFRVTEHGYLFVIASLVPHAYYSTGIRRYLNRKLVGDFAFPLLSGMGDQAIMNSELCAAALNKGDKEFAYTDLYAEYKYHDDEVHGLLRDGSNLEKFALQRGFSDAPVLGSDFLRIPVNFMDQVFAVGVKASNFSCWYDIYFPYKKISTLPEYSLPTLADLKHVHTGYLSRGGKRL